MTRENFLGGISAVAASFVAIACESNAAAKTVWKQDLSFGKASLYLRSGEKDSSSGSLAIQFNPDSFNGRDNDIVWEDVVKNTPVPAEISVRRAIRNGVAIGDYYYDVEIILPGLTENGAEIPPIKIPVEKVAIIDNKVGPNTVFVAWDRNHLVDVRNGFEPIIYK